MKYRAKVDFGGIVSMSSGEVAEIADDSIAKDLLKAGYIEEIGPAQKAKKAEPKAEEEKPKKTTTKKPATRAKKSGVK